MGYNFRVKNAFCVKETREYPFPLPHDPDRVYYLVGIDRDEPDIFTRNPSDGKIYKHTGLGTFGHVIADDEIAPVPAHMLNEDGDLVLRLL